ncbi:MAG: DUF1893 domain-containing protein [Rikenellaceae bacterium]
MAICERLTKEEASAVVANGDDVRSFTQQGVADLYDLLKSDPKFLEGALVADKIVGKGAAALLIKGGVKKVYANTISDGALALFFNESDIIVTYNEKVPYIKNQTKKGWCPLEELCKEETTVETILPKIDSFIKESKAAK